MVEQLADKLEEIWREDLGSLDELFPTDQTLVQKKEDLAKKIVELSSFKEGEAAAPFSKQFLMFKNNNADPIFSS